MIRIEKRQLLVMEMSSKYFEFGKCKSMSEGEIFFLVTNYNHDCSYVI